MELVLVGPVGSEAAASGKLFRPWDAQQGRAAPTTTAAAARRAAAAWCGGPPVCAALLAPPCRDWADAAELPWLEAALEAALVHELAAAEEYARLLQASGESSARHRKLRPKKYRCPHCHVGFSNNGQLKGHIRIHTGERPFKCDAAQCGKTFTRNEELTRHKRIHSGLRPYPCSCCGKKFGRKDHLKKHARTHQPPPQPPALPPLPPLYPYPYIYGY